MAVYQYITYIYGLYWFSPLNFSEWWNSMQKCKSIGIGMKRDETTKRKSIKVSGWCFKTSGKLSRISCLWFYGNLQSVLPIKLTKEKESDQMAILFASDSYSCCPIGLDFFLRYSPQMALQKNWLLEYGLE